MVDAAVAALEIESSSLYSLVIPKIEQYKLFKGVVFDGTEPNELKFAISTNDGVASVKVFSDKADGKPQFHYGADISFVTDDEVTDVAIPEELAVANDQLAEESFYSNGTLFHGDSLQGIKSSFQHGENLWLRCELPKSAISGDKTKGIALTASHANVFVNDLVYQAMLVWVRKHLGQGSLPSSTASWSFYNVPTGKDFLIEISAVETNGQRVSAKLNVLDVDGSLLSAATACEVTASESLNDKFLPQASQKKSQKKDEAMA